MKDLISKLRIQVRRAYERGTAQGDQLDMVVDALDRLDDRVTALERQAHRVQSIMHEYEKFK